MGIPVETNVVQIPIRRESMNGLLQKAYVISIALLMCFIPVFGKQLKSREALMWEVVEWQAEAPDHSSNPFDVAATVTFTHEGSGSNHTTQMFYDGLNKWCFRFVGTQTGQWQFVSRSKAPGLDGLTGLIHVTENPNSLIKGFIRTVGNKFTVQVREASDLRAYVFNVYMSRIKHPAYLDEFGSDLTEVEKKTRTYFMDAKANGFEIIFIHVNNNWFKLGIREHQQHKSQNPDPKAFAVLEKIITTAHKLGGRVHIWAWGDESRKWTPIGLPGGINGKVDRRLQRYIAARLGPIPGWTMGYGFDLHEWTNTEQLNSWAAHLHENFGWQHLLCARGHVLKGPHNINSYDGFGRNVPLKTTSHGPADYKEILDDLNSDKNRPHFYEERHSYKRSGFNLDMDGTRRLLWWETMAGGMGGFFGLYPKSPHPYPDPEQLLTHYIFWHENTRFLLDMQPANKLTDAGYVLCSASKLHYVFYNEDALSVQLDLTSAVRKLPAVAVDTKKVYREIDLGILESRTQKWKAPYRSDWAIAIGNFDSRN